MLEKEGYESYHHQYPFAYIFSQHVVAYAISRSLINVAAFVTYPEMEGTAYEDICPSAEEIQEELVSLYTKWEPEVQILIKVCVSTF